MVFWRVKSLETNYSLTAKFGLLTKYLQLIMNLEKRFSDKIEKTAPVADNCLAHPQDVIHN